MRLLLRELRETLPSLRSQRGTDDPMVYAKFWIPEVNWIWYITEGESWGGDFRFFGYVIGVDEEWEYFSLKDLEVVCSPGGRRVERDLNFTPTRFRSLRLK